LCFPVGCNQHPASFYLYVSPFYFSWRKERYTRTNLLECCNLFEKSFFEKKLVRKSLFKKLCSKKFVQKSLYKKVCSKKFVRKK
jgi:hypothetical protein